MPRAKPQPVPAASARALASDHDVTVAAAMDNFDAIAERILRLVDDGRRPMTVIGGLASGRVDPWTASGLTGVPHLVRNEIQRQLIVATEEDIALRLVLRVTAVHHPTEREVADRLAGMQGEVVDVTQVRIVGGLDGVPPSIHDRVSIRSWMPTNSLTLFTFAGGSERWLSRAEQKALNRS